MVAEIARDPETHGLPISGIGGVTTWRDAAEFLALGAGTVQVCTAAMTYGFKIVEEMKSGLSQYLDESGQSLDRPDRAGGAQCHGLAVPEPQLRDQGADRSGRLHPVRALLRGLRGYLASGDLHVGGPCVRGDRR
jgi:hypothetical protein